MIKVDHKSREITLAGSLSELLEEIGVVIAALFENAAEADESAYQIASTTITFSLAKAMALIHEKFGYDADIENLSERIDEITEDEDDEEEEEPKEVYGKYEDDKLKVVIKIPRKENDNG